MTGIFKYGTRRLLAGAAAILAFCFTAQAFSAPLEIQSYMAKNSGIAEISVIIRWTGYGRIVADRVIPDNLGFLMQIGVLEPVDMTGAPENGAAGGQ